MCIHKGQESQTNFLGAQITRTEDRPFSLLQKPSKQGAPRRLELLLVQ